ncbi:MAG: hypothetical protein ACPG19_05115 [Saprospiraceae bacterium]
MKTLLVPFRIRCLHLTEPLTVAEAAADFSTIPYFDKKVGVTVNTDNPYLSENLLSQPFQNQNLTLQEGVHLHFQLPKRLISSIKVINDEGTTEQAYAPVPNRWLIVKSANGESVKSWVLESDFLWPEDAPPEYTEGKITIPLPVDEIKASVEHSKPFRYMGRLYRLDEWQESGERGTYWKDFFGQPLTALGYGNESFAGFFPNSKDVFSFYDNSEKTTLEKPVKYEIWGWYSDSEDSTRLTDFYEKTDDFEAVGRLTAFSKEFNWNVKNATGQALPEHFMLYSSVKLGMNSHENHLKNEGTEIALGNRGTEALSAFLAQKIDKENKAKVEDQIEAVQMEALQNKKLDVFEEFTKIKHTKGFSAKSGGILWTYDMASDGTVELSNAEFSKDIKKILVNQEVDDLMHDASIILAGLNFLQFQYDKQHLLIQSQRHQLFADWYKYMLAAHPPIGQEKQYPKADEILQFINRFVIKSIHERMESTGVVIREEEEEEDDNFEDDFWFTTKYYDSISEQIVDAFDELMRQLHSANNTIRFLKKEKNTKEAISYGKSEYKYPAIAKVNIGFRILSKPAPRFYETNEPVVLLSGEVTKSTSKAVANELDCYELDWDISDMKAFLPSLNKVILEVQVGNDKHTVRDLMKARIISQQDWHPTLLEWEVSYIPVDDPSDDPVGYELDFITKNFELPEHGTEFQLKKAEKEVFSKKTRYYRSSTILTEYAQKALSNKLEGFIERNKIKDKNNLIVKAVKELKELSILSQSLGGFNQALIMRKQTMQLEIDDPISLPNYEPLIDSIREFIGDNVKSAPDPSAYFNPIKAGGLNIVRLRIIDSFGRTEEVFNGDTGSKAVVANTLTPPLPLQSHFSALLMPRMVQPARLNVRWVASEDDAVEATEHRATTPICGWIIPNFLDETISLFDADGELLGDLGFVEDNIYLVPKPGADTFSLGSIKNKHFNNYVSYMLYQEADFFYDFLGELRDSLEHVDPENSAQQSALSLLTGRPLAIVRASVNFELMEDYAVNQDWNIFRRDLANANNPNHRRATYDFEKVKVPIRLGDAFQLNDGLIGFWKDGTTKNSIDFEDKFYMPAAAGGDVDAYQENSEYIVTAGEGDFFMYQSLADRPQMTTLLFDPRAQLNVACGVLPVKTIDIPNVFWQKALDNMNIQFLVAPIMTLKDKFQIPIPKDANHHWHWIYLQNNKLKEIPSTPTIDRFKLEQAWDKIGGKEKYYLWGTLVESNWISLLEEDVTKGYINYDLASRSELPEVYNEKIINKLFNKLYQSVSSVVKDVQFGQMELREGWLKLKQSQEKREQEEF